jgi:hypothetical protein
MAFQNVANIDDHVEFSGSVVHGSFGFKNFHVGSVSSMREPDGGSNRHGGTVQDRLGQAYESGLDADTGYVIESGQFAACSHFLFSQEGLKQGVIDGFGDIGVLIW